MPPSDVYVNITAHRILAMADVCVNIAVGRGTGDGCPGRHTGFRDVIERGKT
jgi:hypothetical protein